MGATATRRLADLLLDGGLDAFVAERRNAPRPTSWRRIARELLERTGVDVTEATLRNWYGDLDREWRAAS